MTNTVNGRFTPDRFGFTMPASNPPIDRPPYHFRNIESMTFVYDTPTEAAAALLPEGLMLPEGISQASVTFNKFHFSTVGCYNEAIFGIHCTFNGEPVIYYDTILVDNEVGLITGREPYGFAKLFANIGFERENNLIIGWAERPTGKRLVTGTFRPRDPIEAAGPSLPAIALKVIPSPEEGAPPEVAELVMVRTVKSIVQGSDGQYEAFTGVGNVTFDSESVLNPCFRLPVLKMARASWGFYNFTLPYGKILKRYEPHLPAHTDVNGFTVPQTKA